MMLAIDPGPDESGYYFGDPLDKVNPVRAHGHISNWELRNQILDGRFDTPYVVIEDFEPWRTQTGHSIVQTNQWIGRFIEMCAARTSLDPTLLTRRAVCRCLTGDGQATKAAIKAFCVDRWGPGEAKAIGTKKRGTGPLYGLRVHEFDALALAIACVEGPGTTQ